MQNLFWRFLDWIGRVQTIWATIFAIPPVYTAISMHSANMATHEILLFSSSVLALCMFSGYWLHVWAARATQFFSSKKERQRISSQLDDYVAAGMNEIETVTAAAIWAGTLDADNVFRHLKFREIKAAIRSGEISGARQPQGAPGRANKYTLIPVSELKAYFRRKGIVD